MASSASSWTFAEISGDDKRTIASADRWRAAEKASSKLDALRTSKISNSILERPAALLIDSSCTGPVVGSHSTAILASLGLLSLRSSIHFVVKSGKSRKTPVTLPCGRASVAAIPLATGSVSKSSATLGVVSVACRAASTTAGTPLKIHQYLGENFFRYRRDMRWAAIRHSNDKFDLRGNTIAADAEPANDRLNARWYCTFGAWIYKT